MLRRLLLTLAVAASTSATAARGDGWYNAAWKYRIPATITNTSSTSALVYYQCPVALSGAAYTAITAHGQAGLADLRVTDSDGTTPLAFALEGIDSGNSIVYLLIKVSVPANSSKTVHLYYGNAAATSASSYATTIGNGRALTVAADIFTQTSHANYNAEPTVLRLRHQDQPNGGGASHNGDLIATFEAVDSNAAPNNGSIWIIRSTDGGNTWGLSSPGLVASPATGNSFIPFGLCERPDGTILLVYSYDANAAGPLAHERCYVAKSTNAGTTWANLSTTPTNALAVPWTYGTDTGLPFGRMILDGAGNLYQPVYATISGQTGGHAWLLKCLAASDPTVGSNWATQGIIAYDNAHKWSETSVAFTGGGNAVAISREDSVGDLWVTRCTDGSSGVNWGTPAAMGLPGSPGAGQACAPDLLALASGNLLLTYGVRWGTATGIGMILSTDGGITWNDRRPCEPATWPIASNSVYDFGYGSAAQNADGTICVLSARQASASAGGLDFANIFRIVCDEDYVANSGNVYEPSDSLANWSAGANFTADATHVHNGTGAIKLDNSAGTGDWGQRTLWPDPNGSQAWGKVAVSHWIYPTLVGTLGGGSGVMSAGGSHDGGTGGRTFVSVFNSPFHLEWYDWSAYHDTTVPVPLNAWSKQTQILNITASAVAGQLAQNNVVATSALGGNATGAPPAIVNHVGASVNSVNPVTWWLDDVYSHQYAASLPTAAPRGEQQYSGGASILPLGMRAPGTPGPGSALQYATPGA